MTSRAEDPTPEELFADLGLDAGDEAELPPLEGLDALKSRIHEDLEEKQGPFRERGFVARAWPVAMAVVAGLAFAVALSPASLNALAMLSVAGAGASAALAFAAVVLAPSRPGRAELVALAGIGLGVVALALQVWSGIGGERAWLDALPGSFKCFGVLLVGTAGPLLVLALWLRHSGLPVRALHAAGLSVAAFALGGLGVFRHCAPLETWHTLFAHLVGPVAGATIVAALLYRLLQRRTKNAS